MGGTNFSDEEREVFRKCLVAAGDGAFLSDGDFEDIYCLQSADLSAIGWCSDPFDLSLSAIRDAVRGSINGTLLWLRWQDDDQDGARLAVLERTGASPEELEQLERRLTAMEPPKPPGSLSVTGPVQIGGNYYRVVSKRSVLMSEI
jgi:hypothetical protein